MARPYQYITTTGANKVHGNNEELAEEELIFVSSVKLSCSSMAGQRFHPMAGQRSKISVF